MNKYKVQLDDLKDKLNEAQNANMKNSEKIKFFDEKNSSSKITIQNLRKTLKEKEIEIIKQRDMISNFNTLNLEKGGKSSTNQEKKEDEVKIDELNKRVKALKSDLE